MRNPEAFRPEFVQIGGEPEIVEALLKRGRSVGWALNFDDQNLDWERIIRLNQEYENLQVVDAVERSIPQILIFASRFRRFGGFRLALAQSERVLEKEPHHPAGLGFKAIALFCQGQLDEAIYYMGEVKRINPRQVETTPFYNDLLWLKKKYAQDERGLRRYIEVENQHELARTFKEMGQFDRALECYDRALEINPENPGSLQMKGGVLRQLRRDSEAVRYVQRALEVPFDPENRLHCFSRGAAFQALGHFPEAIEWYSKALEIEPHYDQAWINLMSARLGMPLGS